MIDYSPGCPCGAGTPARRFLLFGWNVSRRLHFRIHIVIRFESFERILILVGDALG
jgi:hypothetical protein